MAGHALFVAALSPLPPDATWEDWWNYLVARALPDIQESLPAPEPDFPDFKAREEEDEVRPPRKTAAELLAKMRQAPNHAYVDHKRETAARKVVVMFGTHNSAPMGVKPRKFRFTRYS